jgi:hypothetical protein
MLKRSFKQSTLKAQTYDAQLTMKKSQQDTSKLSVSDSFLSSSKL